jgi:hypothetical protein
VNDLCQICDTNYVISLLCGFDIEVNKWIESELEHIDKNIKREEIAESESDSINLPA